MARTDLLKKLLASYQRHDDAAFRTAADDIIAEERAKHHVVVANELERIMKSSNGNGSQINEAAYGTLQAFSPPPQDLDRKTLLLEVRQPSRYLDELVFSNTIRKSVDRILREVRDWDILESNGLSPSNRVLFCGPSGCGKTAMAQAMATELGLPLLYVRFDAVVSSLLGETAANVRKVFDYARRGRWVMLFDEFDAIGRSRDDATEHGEIKRVVNSFLQIMDGFDGRCVIIAATNFEQALDPAIWRRFDEVIRFERPSGEELLALIIKRLSPLSFKDGQVHILSSSLSGGTFADAERVCLDIRKSSVIRGLKAVSNDDIEEATRRHRYRISVLDKAHVRENPAVDQD